jgi:hypothetical protein
MPNLTTSNLEKTISFKIRTLNGAWTCSAILEVEQSELFTRICEFQKGKE